MLNKKSRLIIAISHFMWILLFFGVATIQSDFANEKVSGNPAIIQIAVGASHSVGLREDGTVFATGDNEYNQCDVFNWSRVKKIYATNFGTYGITDDGHVYATGMNKSGQCNVSSWSNVVELDVTDTNVYGLKTDGTVLSAGDNSYGQCNTTKWRDVKKICASSGYVIGLKNDGTLSFAGPKELEDAYKISTRSGGTSLSVGDMHFIMNQKDGTRLASGMNDSRLKISGFEKTGTAIAKGESTYLISDDGKLQAVGNEVNQYFPEINGLTNVSSISIFQGHVAVLMKDGSVKLYGNGKFESGSEGIKDLNGLTQVKQVVLGQFHALVINQDGTVRGYGNNYRGQTDVAFWNEQPAGKATVKWVAAGYLDREPYSKIDRAVINGVETKIYKHHTEEKGTSVWKKDGVNQKAPYYYIERQFVNGKPTDSIRLSKDKAKVTWNVEGYETVAPYKEYKVLYLDGVRTNTKQYTGKNAKATWKPYKLVALDSNQYHERLYLNGQYTSVTRLENGNWKNVGKTWDEQKDGKMYSCQKQCLYTKSNVASSWYRVSYTPKSSGGGTSTSVSGSGGVAILTEAPGELMEVWYVKNFKLAGGSPDIVLTDGTNSGYISSINGKSINGTYTFTCTITNEEDKSYAVSGSFQVKSGMKTIIIDFSKYEDEITYFLSSW